MTNDQQIHHQNYGLAIRQEMGFPLHHTANQSVAFGSTGVTDIIRSMQIATLADEMHRDVVICEWESVSAKQPAGIAIAYREELQVDWVAGCVLWAANQNAPLVIVNKARKEHFVRGARSMLERCEGLPARNLKAGIGLARRRVRRAAAARPAALIDNNAWVPFGDCWDDHKPFPEGTVLRFGR
jgi:hypothetical protein